VIEADEEGVIAEETVSMIEIKASEEVLS